jgi:predicted nucleic acid-binding protein
MIYIDSNIFVYAAQSSAPKGEKAIKVIQSIQDGNLQAATSILSFDEAVWILRRNIGENPASIAVKGFFSLPDLTIYDVTKEIFLMSLEIMQKEKLKPRDAIHVATMRVNNITKILTEDSDFDKVQKIKRIRLDDNE